MIPSDISGLVLWLKPNIAEMTRWSGVGGGALTTEGQHIGSWNDSSAAGNDVLDAAQSNPPQIRFSVLDDRNVARFGTNSLVCPSLTLGPFTMFYVCRGTSGFVGKHTVGPWSYFHLPGGAHAWVDRGGVQSGFDVATNLADNTWRTLVHRFDGTHAGHILRAAGVDLAKTTVYAGGNPGTGTVNQIFHVGEAFVGDIAEFILYDSSLSVENIEAVEGYLDARFFGVNGVSGGGGGTGVNIPNFEGGIPV